MTSFQMEAGYDRIPGYVGPIGADTPPPTLREQISAWIRSANIGMCSRFWVDPETWTAVTHEISTDANDLTINPVSHQMTVTVEVHERQLPRPPDDVADWLEYMACWPPWLSSRWR